jgi:hypothetical protein
VLGTRDSGQTVPRGVAPAAWVGPNEKTAGDGVGTPTAVEFVRGEQLEGISSLPTLPEQIFAGPDLNQVAVRIMAVGSPRRTLPLYRQLY